MAIQSDNTALSKGDLKAYHERILPYLGGNFMMSTNNSNYYTLEEKIVGIDASKKPLYQKTIANAFTASKNTTSWTIGSAISGLVNIDGLTGVKILGIASNGWSTVGDGVLYFDDANGKTVIITCWVDTANHVIKPYYINKGANDYTVHLVLEYSKTTDAANSALTTPGAYDLNRPDLWPANQEIFFGNGLYGFRATGNMPALAAGTDWTNIRMLTNIGTSGKTFQMGGGLESLNANEVRAWTQLGISRSGNFESTLVVSTNGELQLGVRFPGTSHHSKTTNKYDVWVTYTK